MQYFYISMVICLRLIQILPGLYVGNFRDAKDTEQLKKNKITHILSIHDFAKKLRDVSHRFCTHILQINKLLVLDAETL